MIESEPQPGRPASITRAWRSFVLAVTFLTRLPLPVRWEVTAAELRAGLAWYPLVGAGLGAAGWALFWLGGRVFPATVAAALTVVLLQVCTGALHLDGLMDTCDGVGSGAPRERALEIMKDSRVGAMGVFGAIAVLLLKVTALAALTPGQAVPVFIAGWAAARALPAWAVTLFPYARATGTGKAITEGRSLLPLLLGTLTALAAGYGLLRGDGLLLVSLVLALPLLVQAGVARRLGGLTGDVYGMGIELGEVVALLAGLILRQGCIIELPW